jgi:hypothetical protein
MAGLDSRQDPIAYLGAEGDEYWIREAVARRASEIEGERRQIEFEALATFLARMRI